ncbi:MAG: Glycine betaine methyltransferase [Eubacterium sp.]|uniref:trimethylamine methyltransferase family protein n=1 Tax=Eubacterium sp. TaxID=142586 RepID=UPI0007359F17|nr:trimethylamine methyltransferase family protein [Eubacterium limosum]
MKKYEQYVSKEDVLKIHAYSVRILEEVGVRFEHEKALEVFKKHGARVEGETVFIPEKMIDEVLKYAKKEFTIRSCKGDITIGAGEQHSIGIYGNIYRHHHNGRIEKMTNQDVLDQFKIADTSKIVTAASMNFFLNYDNSFTEDQKIFGNIAMILKYGHKPMIMASPNTFGMDDEKVSVAFRRNIELINQFEGNDDVHNAYVVNTLSPLTLDHDPIERTFILAETKQAIIVTPCAMPLMTAPPSMASMLAMTNAEVLAGYTLAKLLNPEVPVVYGNTSAATDMRTVQLSIGSPESVLVSYATAGLADYYGLPYRTGGGLSDAKQPDIQAGVETMMNIEATRNCEADIVLHTCGCMGSFNVTDFGKFLIDEEMHNMALHINRGINCEDDRFCFDTLKKVGPRGVFLKGRTPKMYREEVYLPKYFNKDDPNQWQNKGSVTVMDVAEEDVRKRLDSFIPSEITKEQNELLLPYIHENYRESI